MTEQVIDVSSAAQVINLFGTLDENLKTMEYELNVQISTRNSLIKIMGDETAVSRSERTIRSLLQLIDKGEKIDTQRIRYIISLVDEGNETQISELGNDVLCVTAKGKPIKPKTLGQKQYIDAIKANTITLGVGPAGTGKTYLAVAAAVSEFRYGNISRIVLTRPAVEAGEKLGFLPGDLQNKVDPYLRPLYDALFDMMGAESFHRHMEKGSIEVAPLAYMRGRTLDDSFVILDEAQNTTPEQMKMFLTRLGFRSKAVVTGDITQTDLQNGRQSGLKDAMRVLKKVDGISQCRLSEHDVVRHELVQKIVKAYETFGQPKDNTVKHVRW